MEEKKRGTRVALVTWGAKIKQGENCCIVDNQPLRKEGKRWPRGRDGGFLRISGYVVEKLNMIFNWKYRNRYSSSRYREIIIKCNCYITNFNSIVSLNSIFIMIRKKLNIVKTETQFYIYGNKSANISSHKYKYYRYLFLFFTFIVGIILLPYKTRHFYYLPSMIHLARLQRNMSAYRSMLTL